MPLQLKRWKLWDLGHFVESHELYLATSLEAKFKNLLVDIWYVFICHFMLNEFQEKMKAP